MEEASTASESSAEAEETVGTAGSTALAEARLSRQQARDSAAELLEELLAAGEADSAELQAATEKAAELAETIVRENNIESLIKAKGYEDCVVYLENDSCNVMVVIELAQPNDAIVIQDIVRGQTDLPNDKIKIVPVS